MSCAAPHFRHFSLVAIVLFALVLAGCSSRTQQVHADIDTAVLTLTPQSLENGGIGFLTPAAATGQETDKQALALVFSDALRKLRPEIRVVSLPEVLSAVNQNDLAMRYKVMYRDYLETGVLERSILTEVAEQAGVRYLAQLSLAGFEQGSNKRFSLFGLRILDTKRASMRVFVQIWDAQTGQVAWEGSQELNFAYDTSAERPVTFIDVADVAAENLLCRLPGGGNCQHEIVED